MRHNNPAVAIALCLFAAAALAGPVNQDQPNDLAAALKLIPPDAVAFAAISDLQRANSEVAGLIAAMDLPESVLAGKPIDQLKALLGVAGHFDDAGALVVWMQMRDGLPVGVLAIPTDDSAAFIAANLLPFVSEDGPAAPEGALGFHGTPVFARAAEKHALVSTDRSLVDSYEPGVGLAASLTARIGAAGVKALERGEFCAWTDGAALAQVRGGDGADGPVSVMGVELSRSPRSLTLSASVQGADAQAPADPWASDLAVAIDVEPLGVCARTFIKPAEGSALSKLAAATGGTRPASFSDLPAQRAYFALAFNPPTGSSIADAIPEGVPLPPAVLAWITGAGELVTQVQLAAYPSKLGILAGGFLNDSAMVMLSPKPTELRDFLRDQLQALPPESEGVRRSVKWEDARQLKDGTTVAAFEVKETALGANGGAGAQAQLFAAQAMVRQALLGPRGLHGFVRCTSDAVVVTFSQRQDVLERATAAAAAGGKTLEGEEIVRAIRPWLLDQPHFIALLWSGQVARAIEQVAGSFGAGGMISLPVDLDPVGFAARIEGGCIDTAIMVPTSVMVAGYEQVKKGAMNAAAVEDPSPVPEPNSP